MSWDMPPKPTSLDYGEWYPTQKIMRVERVSNVIELVAPIK